MTSEQNGEKRRESNNGQISCDVACNKHDPGGLGRNAIDLLSPATMGVQPVYRSDILNPVILTDTANSSIRAGFMLPADYSPNTP